MSDCGILLTDLVTLHFVIGTPANAEFLFSVSDSYFIRKVPAAANRRLSN